jgi:sugar O-acyltransferase (sialic acid O-acetyltransferase NeuD family)
MTLPVIILGAGGHAKVLIATLLLLRRKIVGITEVNKQKQEGYLSGIPIIGNDEAILKYKSDEIELANGIGSVGLPKSRMEIYQKCKRKGYKFASIIHPSAMVMNDVQLGEGVQIMAGAIIQPGCSIGDNTIINTGAIVDHDCVVGDHAHVAPGAVISGGVQIGAMTHIGTAATIIQGIKIGPESIIGAGAVVVNDIPSNVKAVGIPANIIERR